MSRRIARAVDDPHHPPRRSRSNLCLRRIRLLAPARPAGRGHYARGARGDRRRGRWRRRGGRGMRRRWRCPRRTWWSRAGGESQPTRPPPRCASTRGSFPSLTGEIRLQKPPLPYWCAAVLFRLVRRRGGRGAVRPGVLGAAATLLIYDLARAADRPARGAVAGWSGCRATSPSPNSAKRWPTRTWRSSRWRACGRGSGAVARPAGSGRSPGASPPDGSCCFTHRSPWRCSPRDPWFSCTCPSRVVAYHLCYRRPVPLNPIGHAAGILLLLAIALPWPLAVWRSVPHALELWR